MAKRASASILPPDRSVIVLRAGAEIYKKLLEETRKINLPEADPDDDQIPDKDDDPEEFVTDHPAFGAAASGSATVRSTATAAEHAMHFRQALREDDESDGDDAFNL